MTIISKIFLRKKYLPCMINILNSTNVHSNVLRLLLEYFLELLEYLLWKNYWKFQLYLNWKLFSLIKELTVFRIFALLYFLLPISLLLQFYSFCIQYGEDFILDIRVILKFLFALSLFIALLYKVKTHFKAICYEIWKIWRQKWYELVFCCFMVWDKFCQHHSNS